MAETPTLEKLETTWYNGLAWGPEDYEWALRCIETLQRISLLPEAGLGGAGAAPAMALEALFAEASNQDDAPALRPNAWPHGKPPILDADGKCAICGECA